MAPFALGEDPEERKSKCDAMKREYGRSLGLTGTLAAEEGPNQIGISGVRRPRVTCAEE